MPEIILKNITKRWGKSVAVDNLNLVIKDRAFVTLLGPSGCGKTTTLRMIAGLETPTSGQIIIDGVVVFDSERGINVPPNKRDVGFLFQNYALWPHMTVYQNIAFGLENLKWPKDKIKERVYELLAMLKIEEYVDRYPSELSGGQQQRVAIARTLAPNPKVLFMDEPLSNLDAKLRLEMRTELKRLHTETSSTFVYVTHDQLEAMTLATEVCLMEKGLLQQYDPPLTVYSKPNNLFVADFVGNPTMNFINATAILDGDEYLIDVLGYKATFKPNEKLDETIPTNIVLGIRPEYISILGNKAKNGIDAIVYSSLPSGMETILRLKIGETIVTAVVFGIIDYPVDTAIKIDITGSFIVVFDSDSTSRVCNGKLSINK